MLEPSRRSTPHVTDCGDRSLHRAVKRDLHDIMNAENRVAARHAASLFPRRWQEPYPKAVACRRHDLEDLLSAFRFAAPKWRQAARTTNAIERRFREIRRSTRPMGIFADRTSIERVLFAVFTHEDCNQAVSTPSLLTQNS